ncbi:MAG: hypothetical protein RIS63_707, partial [Bacteroidota bacterium]
MLEMSMSGINFQPIHIINRNNKGKTFTPPIFSYQIVKLFLHNVKY